jgi:hypothetical protein
MTLTTFRTGDVIAPRAAPFHVSKVLRVDLFGDAFSIVHLRTYGPEQPSLEAARRAYEDGELSVWVGHAPIDGAGFTDASFALLGRETVSEDELEGYRYYREAMGG